MTLSAPVRPAGAAASDSDFDDAEVSSHRGSKNALVDGGGDASEEDLASAPRVNSRGGGGEDDGVFFAAAAAAAAALAFFGATAASSGALTRAWFAALRSTPREVHSSVS